MKQLYLLPLSLVLMMQGFGAEPALEKQENGKRNPSLTTERSAQADKIVRAQAEKGNAQPLLIEDEYEEYEDSYSEEQYSYQHGEAEGEEEEQDSLVSLGEEAEVQETAPVRPSSQSEKVRKVAEASQRGSNSQKASSLTQKRSTPQAAQAKRQEVSQQAAPSPQRSSSRQTSAAAGSNGQQRRAPEQRATSPKRQQAQVSQRSNVQPQQRAQQAGNTAQRRSAPSASPSRRAEVSQAEDYRAGNAKKTAPRHRLQAQESDSVRGNASPQYTNQSSQQPSPTLDSSPSTPPQAINMPARPVVQYGWNLWIKGEALLWQAVQENMEYAYQGSDGANGASRIRNFVKPNFDWDWGWRFGAGYNIPRDNWDIGLDWTHIENHAHGNVSAGSQDLYVVWSVAAYADSPGQELKAHADWDIHLDQVDLNLGRQFYVGNHLTLRPTVGMRSTWIFQDYDVSLLRSLAKQKSDMTNRYWGFGFFAGVDSDWMLGRGFSIYGDAGLAVLLGFFDVKQHGTVDGTTVSRQTKSFRTGRPIFDLDLGLKWATQFWRDRFGVALKVGYEYHLYFNQNQFMLSSGNDNFEIFNAMNGDLTYQGVTFSAQFDF